VLLLEGVLGFLGMVEPSFCMFSLSPFVFDPLLSIPKLPWPLLSNITTSLPFVHSESLYNYECGLYIIKGIVIVNANSVVVLVFFLHK